MKFKFLMVEMTEAEWQPIGAELIAEYGLSILVSWRMRKELGFVKRHDYVLRDSMPRNVIYLDFFDEMSYTSFAMRYS
jgi:hypothetical protein